MVDPLEAAMAASGIVPEVENVQENTESEISSPSECETSDILNHKISNILKQAELVKPEPVKSQIQSPKIMRKKTILQTKPAFQNSEIFKKAFPQKLILKTQNLDTKTKQHVPKTITLNPEIFKSQILHPKTTQVIKKVALKRPNVELPPGPPGKRLLPVAEAFGMSVGVLEKLFNESVDSSEILILQVTACNPLLKRMEVSDGVHMAKCFLTGHQNTKNFLDNPIIQIVEWRLKLCAGIKLFIVERFVIVKNSLKFPVLGNPRHLDKRTVTASKSRDLDLDYKIDYKSDQIVDGNIVRTIKLKNKEPIQMQDSKLPLTRETWEAISCFLKNVDIKDDMDSQTFLEDTSKEIFSKIINSSGLDAVTPRYECTDCAFKGHYLRYLVNHIQLKHLKHFPGYICPDCGMKVLTFLAFEKHVKSQHYFQIYERESSKSKGQPKANSTVDAFNIIGSMEDHFLFVNRPAEDQKEEEVEDDMEADWAEKVDSKMRLCGDLFHCTDCDYNNKDIEELMHHIQWKHVPNFPGYTCLNCRQHFQYFPEFLHHFRLTHTTIKITETYKHIQKTVKIPKFSLKASSKLWLNSSSDTRML